MNASKQQESEQLAGDPLIRLAARVRGFGTLETRIHRCIERISQLAKEGKLSMSVPVEPTDDDIFITCTLIDAKSDIECLRKHTPATPSADEEIERGPLETTGASRAQMTESQFLILANEKRERDVESDSIVASCNCLTKTNEILHHKPGCKYRLIVERDVARATLAAREGELEWMTADRDVATKDRTDLRAQLSDLKAELATAQSELVEVRSKLNREIENHDSLRSQLTEAQKLISDNHLVIEGLGDDLKEANAKLAEAAKLIGDAINYAEMPFEAKDCMRRFLTRLSP